jgi:hypothetical protein
LVAKLSGVTSVRLDGQNCEGRDCAAIAEAGDRRQATKQDWGNARSAARSGRLLVDRGHHLSAKEREEHWLAVTESFTDGA